MSSSTNRILIVVHQETSSPGRVGLMLRERGFGLDIRRPCLGQPLPETLEDHEGVVIFGGPMSANDCSEFIRQETEWIGQALKEEKPFLGICLGAQMLSRHLGGEVKPHPEGLVEIGYYPIEATAEGRALMHWPSHVYHWHREGFSLPSGATLLAQGTDFENQAFRYGKNAYGIQFHPEITLQMLHRWTTRGVARTSLPGAQPRDAHFEGRRLHDAAVRVWLTRFMDHWLADAGRGEMADAAE
ncbi:GMP synthase (glutamine-hydrolyzing) [Rhodoligotrophos appendicifer]|uniref:glutamine amidotransferase n=1 Tax=Rhodoligotrophos appendicifer TaxID=987056 RepID=UPI00117D5FEC|nr:glutamine amidotransferase [Rhodoligotrophos appendicifer]